MHLVRRSGFAPFTDLGECIYPLLIVMMISASKAVDIWRLGKIALKGTCSACYGAAGVRSRNGVAGSGGVTAHRTPESKVNSY